MRDKLVLVAVVIALGAAYGAGAAWGVFALKAIEK